MAFVETEKRPQGEPTTREMDEASKLLLRAADYVEQYGWHQGDSGSTSQGICVVHAMVMAGGCMDHPGYRRLYQHIGKAPSIWNDEPGRTKEEVIAKLRSVALGG